MVVSNNTTSNGKKEIFNFLSNHSSQLVSSAIPEHLWPTIFEKIENQVYDAGHYFQMCQEIEEESDLSETTLNWKVIVIYPQGLSVSHSQSIFLIDHAWTYQPKEAKAALVECEGLLERMCNLMNIQSQNVVKEDLINQVLKEMWKFNSPYSVTLSQDSSENIPAENKLQVWYIMDEFGSRIQHDGDPNFRVVPFYYLPHQCCYSLLFPIKDVEEGEEITRNYVESPPVDELTRDAQMLPWFPVDLSDLDTKQEEPPLHFFAEDISQPEDVPESPISAEPLASKGKIKVYSDYKYIREYLTDGRFALVDCQEDADVIWISTHFKDFKSLAKTPSKRINQFPCESLITVKDLLAIVNRRCGEGGSSSSWAIPTFCLKRELPQFIAYFQKKEKLGLDNTWIIKPWNLARCLDQCVTNNLNQIVRLPSTGPKIAQKYLHNPVLFHRKDISAKVKFDLRFIVLLLNVKPLQFAVYKNFWIRFANKSFDLEDFEDYQKHFTVNNYNDASLLQMFCQDFITEMAAQYPLHPWTDIRAKIYKMMTELFEGATRYEEPKGIPHNPQCKSSYGFDIMLDWVTVETGIEQMEPKLLEVNFNSDSKRACEYYPQFFNDLFTVMFLDDRSCETVDFL